MRTRDDGMPARERVEYFAADKEGVAAMTTANSYVRARIDTDTKERAAEALEAMGLSISDAIRLLMLRIADERRLPFEVKRPNATTRKAIAELEAGKGKRFASVEALIADLHADD
jgi:DNA-damage-inducible protein J